mgnify:CR=1 FL=1
MGRSEAWHAYKHDKEAWVAGQKGTSIVYINAVSATSLVSYALWIYVRTYGVYAWMPYVWDFGILIMPLMLACTILADRAYSLVALMLIFAVAFARLHTKKTSQPPSGSHPRSYITVYRAYLMVLTIFCILAVDFPIFPRFLAKCETWGTSLMDLGVGSFTFSHGLVSLRTTRSSWSRLARRTMPLLILGAMRILLVKRTKYPEHVSEYGVHWNFFITMGLLLPSIDLVQRAWPSAPWAVVALCASILHGGLLVYTPLGAWSVSDVRDSASWVSLNKEGMTSLPGYVCIALFGLDVGRVIFTASEDRRRVHRSLLVRAVALWAFLICLRLMGLQASRRMANMLYVLWCAAFNVSFLLGFMLLEHGRSDDLSATPPLFETINRHSLLLFLLSNLATGVVNLLVSTMYASVTTSMTYLFLYMLAMCGLVPAGLSPTAA